MTISETRTSERGRRRWTTSWLLVAATVLLTSGVLPGAATALPSSTAESATAEPAAAEDATPLAFTPPVVADALLIAWVGGPTQPPTLVTLQAALTAAAVGDSVNLVPGSYRFNVPLTVPSAVTLTVAAETWALGRFTVSGGGLARSGPITLGPAANSQTVVTVASDGAALTGLAVANPESRTGFTGISLGSTVGAAVSGVSIDGASPTGTTTGINVATSTGAAITNTTISGVSRGVFTTATNAGPGTSITGGTIRTAVEGVNLGATTGSVLTGVTFDGGNAPGSTTTAVNVLNATGVVITDAAISGVARGIFVQGTNTGAGPRIVGGTITVTVTGISLGTTTGSHIEDVTVAGPGIGGTTTGIQVARAGGVVIVDPQISAFTRGIYATWIRDSGREIPGPSVTGAVMEEVGIGIYTANTTGMDVSDAVIDATGSAVYAHESADITVTGSVFTGHAGSTASNGTNGIRFYYVQGATISDTRFDGGSTGLYFDGSYDIDMTGVEVENQAWYGIYTESVTRLTITRSSFHDLDWVANYTYNPSGAPPLDQVQVSSAIVMTDNEIYGVNAGIYLPLGAYDITFSRNAVRDATEFVVLATPAHDVTVSDNDIDFTGADENAAAVRVTPLFWNLGETTADTGSYSSSGIRVLANRFTGAGTFVAVGSVPGTGSAGRRALTDTIQVFGNTFPQESTAVRAFTNAEAGADTDPTNDMIDGDVAVDARDDDQDGANDWGAPCRARVTLGESRSPDDPVVYDGGGAWIHQTTSDGQVLYPETCSAVAEIDLTLTQTYDPGPYEVGDVVTWTLVPHNDGPRVAAAGWAVTQLLDPATELVGMTGDGYQVTGTTAVAPEPLGIDADGPPIRVTVRIVEGPAAMSREAEPLAAPDPVVVPNTAYIAPADGDVPESNPLVVPELGADTAATATNNDTDGEVHVVAAPVPEPTPTPTPTPTPEPTVPAPGPTAPGAVPSAGPGAGSGDGTGGLASTGADTVVPAMVSAVFLLAGAALLALRRRAHR